MTTPDSRLFARVQSRSADRAERRGGAAIRRELAAGLSGHVLELGPGSGLQFAHYPAGVRRVTAIEPEPTLRHMALRAPSAVPVTVLNASAAALPLADATVDAVVCSAVLCSPPGGGRTRTVPTLRAVACHRRIENRIRTGDTAPPGSPTGAGPTRP